jgi:hypothetical protein
VNPKKNGSSGSTVRSRHPNFLAVEGKTFYLVEAGEKAAFCTVIELRYEIFIRKVRKHQKDTSSSQPTCE